MFNKPIKKIDVPPNVLQAYQEWERAYQEWERAYQERERTHQEWERARQRWQRENKEKHKAHQRKQHAAVRLKVLSRYGGTVPKCACCGETENKFLAFDHINGRKGVKKVRGVAWYRELAKSEMNPNIQILCHNCNLAKGFYGKCPHQALTIKPKQGQKINV